MDHHINISLLLLIFLTHYHLVLSNNTSISCNETPYPKLCNSLTTTTPTQNLSHLHAITLQATLTQAQTTHNLISQTNLTPFDSLTKSAWIDCLDLYEDTIHQLNRSLNHENSINTQTWLSAAIANEQACRNGFLDFNLSISQLQSLTHFSKLLSNSLAINKAMSLSSSSPSSSSVQMNRNRRLLFSDEKRDHFPEWVSSGERKLLRSTRVRRKADIVVAQDGSGDYRTINEALSVASKQRSGTGQRFVIYVKKGIYRENVEVKRSMKNLMFIGDGIDVTIITGSKNVQDGSTTFRSATFAVTGDGFIAKGITFENTAGPMKNQAVALRSGSDFSIFYQCSFKGYQDTLYVHSQRQFYRDCDIYGTIDFIFGDAVTVIQNSNIYIRQPLPNQKNTVTAQGRKDPNENTGIIIHNSLITGAGGGGLVSYRSYLGRPWKKYSRTVFITCRIDGLIDPAGWLPWNGDFGLSTLYYGEFMNTGSGAGILGRVKWPGFHVIRSVTEVERFSVGNFLAGDSWIPAAGVPFTSRL